MLELDNEVTLSPITLTIGLNQGFVSQKKYTMAHQTETFQCAMHFANEFLKVCKKLILRVKGHDIK